MLLPQRLVPHCGTAAKAQSSCQDYRQIVRNSLLQWKDQAFQRAPVHPSADPRYGLSVLWINQTVAPQQLPMPTDSPLFFPHSSSLAFHSKQFSCTSCYQQSSSPAILASLACLPPHLKGLVRKHFSSPGCYYLATSGRKSYLILGATCPPYQSLNVKMNRCTSITSLSLGCYCLI